MDPTTPPGVAVKLYLSLNVHVQSSWPGLTRAGPARSVARARPRDFYERGERPARGERGALRVAAREQQPEEAERVHVDRARRVAPRPPRLPAEASGHMCPVY